jgi:hypothetical protein
METPDLEKTKKQDEKEKRIPWEILLIIAAILMVVLRFIGE